MTRTHADPGAIDLDWLRGITVTIGLEWDEEQRANCFRALNDAIAAVEALRARVAELCEILNWRLDQVISWKKKAEAAEARAMELAGALSELLRWHRNQEPGTDEPPGEIIGNAYTVLAATLAATPAENELEASLKNALMAGIQTGVGETFHPDAKALIVVAFKDGADAEKFHLAYVRLRAMLDALGQQEDG